jgi:type I site-specific restriction endonuclease|tara:strand:+ start:49 stop:399 length:351 start_codon:yes stop_codon:yes gene_type:complete
MSWEDVVKRKGTIHSKENPKNPREITAEDLEDRKFTEANIREFDLQPDAFSPRRQASIGQMRTAHFDVLELLNDLEDYTDGDLQQNEKLLKDTTTKEIESLIVGLNKVAVLLGDVL